MASVYGQFKRERTPDAVPGFCAVATLDKIRDFNYALTPGRYVGASEDGEEDEPFEERFPKLMQHLRSDLAQADKLREELEVSFRAFSLNG